MEYEIPQGIDDPPQVLLWNLNELAPIVLGLVIGMITGNAMLLTAGGLIITHIYRRAGDAQGSQTMLYGPHAHTGEVLSDLAACLGLGLWRQRADRCCHAGFQTCWWVFYWATSPSSASFFWRGGLLWNLTV